RRPVDLERQTAGGTNPLELSLERGRGLRRQRRQRPFEGPAKLAHSLLELGSAALALLAVERLLGAQGKGDPEQPLEHLLVDLPGQVESFAQAAVALLLAGG